MKLCLGNSSPLVKLLPKYLIACSSKCKMQNQDTSKNVDGINIQNTGTLYHVCFIV